MLTVLPMGGGRRDTPVQTTRGVALLAASVLAMSGLAACGDEGGDAAESSSKTASPSAPEKESGSEESGSEEASESSTSEASGSSEPAGDDEVAELPAAAKKQTKAGAVAFNEFYQEQMGEALKTGRVETLKEYSQGCDACDEYVRDTERATSRGVKMDKNPNVIGDTSATKRVDSGYKVTVEVKAKEYQEVLSDGSRGRKADAVTYTIATDTQWSEGHWVIRDSVIVE